MPLAAPQAPVRSRAGDLVVVDFIFPSIFTTNGCILAAPLPPLPSAAELRAAIPEDGILMGDLLKKFRGALPNPVRKDQFLKTLKTLSVYDKTSKRILQK